MMTMLREATAHDQAHLEKPSSRGASGMSGARAKTPNGTRRKNGNWIIPNDMGNELGNAVPYDLNLILAVRLSLGQTTLSN
jgi:hypothetical protein